MILGEDIMEKGEQEKEGNGYGSIQPTITIRSEEASTNPFKKSVSCIFIRVYTAKYQLKQYQSTANIKTVLSLVFILVTQRSSETFSKIYLFRDLSLSKKGNICRYTQKLNFLI